MSPSFMPETRIGRIVVFTACVATLLLFITHFHSQAFVELSPEFNLPKEQVSQQAARIATRLNLHPKQYQRALTFEQASTSKNYFELEYNLDMLREQAGRGVRLWYWRTRFFRPGEEEEFRVSLDTEGRLVGFRHKIPETTERPELDEEQARAIAQTFLDDFVPRHAREHLRATEHSQESKPGYMLHRFTWEREDWTWGEAKYHIHVNVAGDRVGYYSEHVDVPESWRRDYRSKRADNQIFQTMAQTGTAVLFIAALIVFVRLLRQGQVRWHGFPLLWMWPVATVLLLAQFSQFPEYLASYATEDNYNSHLAITSIRMVSSTVITLIGFLLVAFVADNMWSASFPGHTPIRALLNTRGLATVEAQRAVPLAFLLALLTLAYVTAYYVFGHHLGFWTPSSIDQSKVMTSYLPAIEAMSIGVSAAWLEEFMFRVIALIAVYRLSGSRWAAITISAVVWGFLHSNYPQLPGYARGIELTLEGILLGWMALRFGILTTLLSHCLYNTWLGATIAWQTGSGWQMVLAAAVSLWPLMLWWYGWRQAGKLGAPPRPEQLVAGSEPMNQQLHDADALLSQGNVRLENVRRHTLMILALLTASIAVFYPANKLGDLGAIEIHREQATRIADDYFESETGLQAGDFFHHAIRVASLGGGDYKYLLAHGDFAQIKSWIHKRLYRDYWRVAYFQEKQRTRYWVYLDSTGEPILLRRSIADSEAGAELDESQAQELAAQHLREYLNLGANDYRYVGHDVTQHDKRRDYEVTFESVAWQFGESKLRWDVHIQGDRINGFSQYVKIPEDYVREQHASDWQDAINELINSALQIAMIIAYLLLAAILLSRNYIPWRTALSWALLPVLVNLMDYINGLPGFFDGYATTQSLANYIGTEALDLLSAFGQTYLSGVVLLATVFGLTRWLAARGPRELFMPRTHPPRELYRDGLVLGLAFALTMIFVTDLSQLLLAHVAPEKAIKITTAATAGYWPGLGIVFDAASAAMVDGASHAILALVVVLLWHKHRGLLALLVGLAALRNLNVDWSEGPRVVHGLFFSYSILLLKLWIFIRVFRFNPYAFISFAYFTSLLSPSLILVFKAWPAYSGDVIIVALAALAPWWIPGLWRRVTRNAGQAGYG